MEPSFFTFSEAETETETDVLSEEGDSEGFSLRLGDSLKEPVAVEEAEEEGFSVGVSVADSLIGLLSKLT